jgi:Rrf2 family protein
MEISRQADYAVRAIMELSRHGEGERLQSSDIAARGGIPEKHITTIIRSLARGGIIRTYRGSRGGVTLASPPGEITLRSVVEAIDGPLLLNRCRLQPGSCAGGNGERCAVHDYWERMTDDILDELESVSFAQLAEADLVDGPGF